MAGQALEAKMTSPGPSWWVASAVRNARAFARRSSSAITKAGVPCARASSTASQPPMARRPPSADEDAG